MDRYMSAALDRYITGNYGEDQFRGCDEYEDFVDRTCAECLCQKWCPTLKEWYDSGDYTECLVVKGVMAVREAQDAEYERDADEHYAVMEEELLAEDSGTWVSDDSTENWNNNYIQFARLIAEANAVGAIAISSQELCEAMGLSVEQIGQIIERAQYSWDKIQEQLKVREDNLNRDIEKAIMMDAMRNGRRSVAKKKQTNEDITIDFYNGNRIRRPDPHSALRYDFDVRIRGERIWKYVNSSDDLSAFNEQVKIANEGDGEYRILISETQEVIRTNVK